MTVGLTSSLIEFTCSACPQLDEGTTYFVIAVPSTGGNPLDVTDWNKVPNEPTPFYFNESGEPSGPWDIDSSGTLALQVDGEPVTGSSVPSPRRIFAGDWLYRSGGRAVATSADDVSPDRPRLCIVGLLLILLHIIVCSHVSLTVRSDDSVVEAMDEEAPPLAGN